MGVTIYYQGKLKDEENLAELKSFAQNFSEDAGWGYDLEKNGIKIIPDEQSDPLNFIFEELRVDDFVKTQFAGADIHIKVVELIKELGKYFENLEVSDEGEYWETGSLSRLLYHLNMVNNILKEKLAKNENLKIKVKLSDGRWLDAVDPEKDIIDEVKCEK